MSEEVILPIHSRNVLPLTVQTSFNTNISTSPQPQESEEECYISPGSDDEFWESMLRSPVEDRISEKDIGQEEDEIDEADDVLDTVLTSVSSSKRPSLTNWSRTWDIGLQMLQNVTHAKMEKLITSGEASLHKRMHLSLLWDKINRCIPEPPSLEAVQLEDGQDSNT
jgi:hypothetical protein